MLFKEKKRSLLFWWSIPELITVCYLSTFNRDFMVFLALQFVAFQLAVQNILENQNTGK